jgi:hypothetical protein
MRVAVKKAIEPAIEQKATEVAVEIEPVFAGRRGVSCVTRKLQQYGLAVRGTAGKLKHRRTVSRMSGEFQTGRAAP